MIVYNGKSRREAHAVRSKYDKYIKYNYICGETELVEEELNKHYIVKLIKY